MRQMPDRLSLHAPTLVNTLGHTAGAIIFAILLYLLFLDWRRNPSGKRILPSAAAALALVWNVGSMVGLATDPRSGFLADLIIAISFSVLSCLPAVLLHISRPDSKYLVIAGYVVGFAAAVLHFTDLFTGSPRYHYAAILLITIGFGILTSAAAVLHPPGGTRREANHRLAGAMVLFLFAISFAHFSSNHAGRAWSGEIALHHAGIPLALFVLLRDYRFLLLDTFIRFLVNALLAAAAIAVVVAFGTRFDPLRELQARPFAAGLAFAGACMLLILFGHVRRIVQAFVTRVLFLRTNSETIAAKIQGITSRDEDTFLAEAAKVVASYISCDQVEIIPFPVTPKAPWVELALPIVFARGDSVLFCLGARRGGRVFLSEDLAALSKLLIEVARQVDRLRAAEMQTLLVKGELQALQAQINPHFLFNTLNTIYGCIPRTNTQARNLILNLSDVLRCSLSDGGALIPLNDELRIVRAYLEIEQARLGSRLHCEINVDERASIIEIPALSIQPLVENAVKHGAGVRAGSAYVKLTVCVEKECVRVAVSNSGPFVGDSDYKGNGLALRNVRRRLDICYGNAAHFRIESGTDATVVGFDLPMNAFAVS